MSAQVKKAGRIGTKIVAAFLFLFFVIFNIEVGLYDGEASESGILGLTMSMFVPSAYASDPCDMIPAPCFPEFDYTIYSNGSWECSTGGKWACEPCCNDGGGGGEEPPYLE